MPRFLTLCLFVGCKHEPEKTEIKEVTLHFVLEGVEKGSVNLPVVDGSGTFSQLVGATFTIGDIIGFTRLPPDTYTINQHTYQGDAYLEIDYTAITNVSGLESILVEDSICKDIYYGTWPD